MGNLFSENSIAADNINLQVAGTGSYGSGYKKLKILEAKLGRTREFNNQRLY